VRETAAAVDGNLQSGDNNGDATAHHDDNVDRKGGGDTNDARPSVAAVTSAKENDTVTPAKSDDVSAVTNDASVRADSLVDATNDDESQHEKIGNRQESSDVEAGSLLKKSDVVDAVVTSNNTPRATKDDTSDDDERDVFDDAPLDHPPTPPE
jgi:hypothetical protein